MNLHTIKPAKGATHKEKRLGRGEASGKGGTSTKGNKGGQSRAGYQRKMAHEGGQMPIQRRMPKVGFRSAMKRLHAEVRLDELLKVEGTVVDIESLRKARVISADAQTAKVVLSGEIKKAYTLKGVAAPKGARAASEAAGGKIEA